jgi:hypothetical protein
MVHVFQLLACITTNTSQPKESLARIAFFLESLGSGRTPAVAPVTADETGS